MKVAFVESVECASDQTNFEHFHFTGEFSLFF